MVDRTLIVGPSEPVSPLANVAPLTPDRSSLRRGEFAFDDKFLSKRRSQRKSFATKWRVSNDIASVDKRSVLALSGRSPFSVATAAVRLKSPRRPWSPASNDSQNKATLNDDLSINTEVLQRLGNLVGLMNADGRENDAHGANSRKMIFAPVTTADENIDPAKVSQMNFLLMGVLQKAKQFHPAAEQGREISDLESSLLAISHKDVEESSDINSVLNMQPFLENIIATIANEDEMSVSDKIHDGKSKTVLTPYDEFSQSKSVRKRESAAVVIPKTSKLFCFPVATEVFSWLFANTTPANSLINSIGSAEDVDAMSTSSSRMQSVASDDSLLCPNESKDKKHVNKMTLTLSDDSVDEKVATTTLNKRPPTSPCSSVSSVDSDFVQNIDDGLRFSASDESEESC